MEFDDAADLDEAAELLDIARDMLNVALPIYVDTVRADGNEQSVLDAIDGDESWEIAYELLAAIPYPDDGPLIDALHAVAADIVAKVAEILRDAE